jgi:hypothetical protein
LEALEQSVEQKQVIPELSDFSVLQEEWRSQIKETTTREGFPAPNLYMSQVSMQDNHLDHLPKGLDRGKLLREKDDTRGRSLRKPHLRERERENNGADH